MPLPLATPFFVLTVVAAGGLGGLGGFTLTVSSLSLSDTSLCDLDHVITIFSHYIIILTFPSCVSSHSMTHYPCKLIWHWSASAVPSHKLKQQPACHHSHQL